MTMLAGLALFGIAFALNSAVHSYLVLAYSEADRVSLSVGFYYMANAAGRLMGTMLSGLLYQTAGVAASLWGAVALAAAAGLIALSLPPVAASASWERVKADD
jgi:MFS family permease